MLVDDFTFVMYASMSFFILLSVLPLMYRTTYRIVQEKSDRMKETMRIMGLGDTPYWTSWLCYYLPFFSAASSSSSAAQFSSAIQSGFDNSPSQRDDFPITLKLHFFFSLIFVLLRLIVT